MRALLVLFGLAVGLLLAEGGSRIVDRLQCRDNPGMFWEPNRWVGWTHTPDARGWAQRCLRGKIEWRVYTRINGHGLRDRDVPYEPQGRFRILVLGDSFTEGIQVEQDETFPKLLEQRLGGGVEVLNAGVSGYGTDSELLFWESEGWKYRPDLVLLVFDTSNDILENHYRLMRGTHFPYPEKPHFVLKDGRLVPENLPLPEEPPVRRTLVRLQRWLTRHSTLYRLLPAFRVPGMPGGAQAAPPPTPFPGGTLPTEVYLADYPESWRVAWRITRGLLLRVRQDVEARGSRFAVVVINAKEEVSDRRWQWTLFANPASTGGTSTSRTGSSRASSRAGASRRSRCSTFFAPTSARPGRRASTSGTSTGRPRDTSWPRPRSRGHSRRLRWCRRPAGRLRCQRWRA